MQLPTILYTISEELQQNHAKSIVVGGSVRDHFLKLPLKDYDIEVYGLNDIEVLEEILAQYGLVNLVGKSFGVLKFSYEGEEYDFSFPRTEYKIAEGHRGFEVSVDRNLDFKDAAKRRDFTVNALGYDIQSQQFLDPFGGLDDMKKKKLRHIEHSTFIEDPLRVYRATQFIARFGFELTNETFLLCEQMVKEGMLEELPKERVYLEWKKLLLKSIAPSKGFELMRKLGIIERYYPELHALIGTPQSPKWHPEGDVWIHTMMTLDAMRQELEMKNDTVEINEKQQLKLLFAILCHDLGKALSTTINEEGNIRSIGHEKTGLEPSKSLMYRLMDEHAFIKSVLPLVEHHLKPSQFYADKSKSSTIRRLATKVNIEELIQVAKADFLGRTTEMSLKGIYDAGDWLRERAKELSVADKPLANLLQGRDLIALGLQPSAMFQKILDEVYTLQLEGKLKDKKEAIGFVKENRTICSMKYK